MSPQANGVAALAGRLVTRDGFAFDMAAEVWRVRTPFGRFTFDFDLPGASMAFRAALRATMARRLASQRPGVCYTDLGNLRVLLRHLAVGRVGRPVDVLSLADFHSYQGSVPATRLGLVRRLLVTLRRLARAGFAGIAADLELSLPILDPYVPPSCSSVGMMCPTSGALTKAEKAELVRQVHAQHGTGEIDDEAYALCLIVAIFSPRPAQIALLKVRDLVVSDGVQVLHIPRVKQQDGSATRASFDTRPLVPSVAAVVARQCRAAAEAATVMGLDPAEAAVFPSRPGPGSRDFPELDGFVGHSTAGLIAIRIARYLSRTRIMSERTGEVQHVTAVRMRRTLATGLRANGRGYALIGRLLGHGGARTARTYCEDTVEMVARVNEALDQHLVPIAALFVDPPSPSSSDNAWVRSS